LLNDFWRYLITLVGFVLTAAGLVYAILQIRKTKTAAEAAEVAAKKALTESRQNFQRYVAATAHRFVGDAKRHVSSQDYEKAATRLEDLADQAVAFMDEDWRQLADDLRSWAARCMKHARGVTKAKFPMNNWDDFPLRLQRMIDHYHGPFAATSEEGSDDSGA
jgi:hypothetical protein